MNKKLLVIVIIVIACLLVGWGAWYLYDNLQYQSYINQPNEEANQNGQNAATPSDTTASISTELNQTPDDASLNAEMNALDKEVQGF